MSWRNKGSVNGSATEHADSGIKVNQQNVIIAEQGSALVKAKLKNMAGENLILKKVKMEERFHGLKLLKSMLSPEVQKVTLHIVQFHPFKSYY